MMPSGGKDSEHAVVALLLALQRRRTEIKPGVL